MLYLVTKRHKKRIFLKLLCTKEQYIDNLLNKIDITDII